MKVILIIDKPTDCSKCPVREIFYDSDWNIKQGIRHMSCRLNLDRASEVGKGIPTYCPLKPVHALKSAGKDYVIYERKYLYDNLEREMELMKKAREFDESNISD